MKNKIYTIFAGVNGSGKSTLYNTEYYNRVEPRVNPDEIVQSFGDWRNEADQVKGAKIAVKKIKEYIEKGISFNQETTLAGKSMERNIKKAKEQGFKINMLYVGLESAELAKERVKLRVLKGGHDIPEVLIEKRYKESLNNLKKLIPLCDLVKIFDNSSQFKLVVLIKDNKIKNEPSLFSIKWTKEIVKDIEKLGVSEQTLTDENQIRKVLKQGGYKATNILVEDMKKLNLAFQKTHSVQELRNLKVESQNFDPNKRSIIEQISKDFIKEEKNSMKDSLGIERD